MKQVPPMKLNYVVLGTGKETRVKFFYEGDNQKYGEFYIYFKRESFNIANPKDNLGVRGTAELSMKDKDYAFDLLQALALALGTDIHFASHVISGEEEMKEQG